MVVSKTMNIPEFHSVWADSLISIVNLIGSGKESDARKIIIFNIRQAYILYRMDDQKQRADIEAKLLQQITAWNNDVKHKPLQPAYFDVLNSELESMKLEDARLPDLQIMMFIYMTLAGIKPVQSSQQRAAGFARFVGAEGSL